MFKKNGSLLTYQIGRKEPLYHYNLPAGNEIESVSNDAAFVMVFNANDPPEHKLFDTKADLIQSIPEYLNFSALPGQSFSNDVGGWIKTLESYYNQQAASLNRLLLAYGADPNRHR